MTDTTDRAALSPPAEGGSEAVSAAKYDWPVTEHGVATDEEVETAIVRLAADDAVLAYRLQGRFAAPKPTPVDHIGDATEKVDWARCHRCGGEIQGWICQDCHQEFEENDASELVFCPSESVDWTVVGPKLVEALEPFALMSSEGVVGTPVGQVSVRTCAEYFHRARDALAPTQPQSNGE